MSTRRWPLLGVAALLMTSCSLTGPGTLESLRERHDGAGSSRLYDSLDDLLDNTRYQVGDTGADAEPLTTAVVVGRFESVAPGRAFTVDGQDAPGGQAADFDDPDAVWKTVEGSFVVDHVVSGNVATGERLTVGLAVGPDTDPDNTERDLRALGRTVLFLQTSPVFADNPQVHGIVGDGALIATVSDDGTLALPVLQDDEAVELLDTTPTLDALTTAATRPPRVFVLDPSGTEILREVDDAP